MTLLTWYCYYLLFSVPLHSAIFIFILPPVGFSSLTLLFSLFALLSAVVALIYLDWFIVRFAYRVYHRNDKIESTNGKAVIVTGCDSGFGFLTALRLDKLGFNVFATVLNPESEGASRLRQECSRIKIVRMDLRNDDEIKNLVYQVKESGQQLWALVNNAGVVTLKFTEFDQSSDILKNTFDINLFGPVKLTKLCLPMLRQAKGRIVNVTSVAAQCEFNLTNAYTMSKHAFRAFSNGLRIELAPFGVQVICIEPGAYMTNIGLPVIQLFNKSIEQTDPAIVGDYQKHYGDLKEGFDVFYKTNYKMASNNLDQVAAAVETAVVNRHPMMSYRVSDWLLVPMCWLMTRVTDEVACWFNCFIMKKTFSVY